MGLGSGKNLFRISDSGVQKAPDPGSATLPATNVREADLKETGGGGPGRGSTLVDCELVRLRRTAT
jgi:hypothetical protein